MTPPPSQPPRSWNGEGEVIPINSTLRTKTRIVCSILPLMSVLTTLSAASNNISDDGACALAAVLTTCASLTVHACMCVCVCVCVRARARVYVRE